MCAMWIGTQLFAADADYKPQSFAAKSDDPALLKAIAVIRGTTVEAKRLGFPETLPFDERPLKSVFYPRLGFAEHIKSFQIPCVEMTGANGVDWWIDILEDGLILHEFLFSPPVRPQAKPFVPNLSKDEAVKKCRGFLALLFKDANIHLKENEIEFAQDMNYANRSAPYRSAHWRAMFQRVSKTGIPVMEDSVSVWLDERFGLRLFKNDCLSQLAIPADEKPLVSKETATKEAMIFAQRVKNESPAVRGYFVQFTLDKTPVATELMICRPNEILTCSDFHGLKRGSTSVLVWAITFKLTSPNGRLAPGMLQIFIDAVTGRFVGGVC